MATHWKQQTHDSDWKAIYGIGEKFATAGDGGGEGEHEAEEQEAEKQGAEGEVEADEED